MSDQPLSSNHDIQWPASKGDPIDPVWSYGGKKGMYQAEALRMFAHDLVERVKELELPVREAMRQACGDGLSEMAYCRMLQKRIDYLERERKELESKVMGLQVEIARSRAAEPPPAGQCECSTPGMALLDAYAARDASQPPRAAHMPASAAHETSGGYPRCSLHGRYGGSDRCPKCAESEDVTP